MIDAQFWGGFIAGIFTAISAYCCLVFILFLAMAYAMTHDDGGNW